MDQVPNRANVPADPRAMVADPRIMEKRVVQDHRPKRSDELVVADNHQFFGLDKNLLITFAVVGVSLMFSMYLFREVKKIRDEVRTIKAQEPDQELAEKVEENSEAVKAIETKLDQLITALGARERRMQQMAQQLQPQQGMMQQQQPPQQMMMQQPQQVQQQMMMQQPQQVQQQHPQPMMMQQPPPVTEQEYQNQQIMQQQMAQQQAQQQQMEAQQMAQQPPQMVMSQPQIPVMGGRLAGSAVTVDDPGIIRI